MNTATLEIRTDLKDQLDHLAEASHRSESELANEALSLYLAQQHRITARIQEGLAQAQRGELCRTRRWRCSSRATLSHRHETRTKGVRLDLI